MFCKQNPKKLVILDILEIVFSAFTLLISILLASIGKTREYLYLIVALSTLLCLYHGITNLLYDIMLLPEKEDKKIKAHTLKHTMSCSK